MNATRTRGYFITGTDTEVGKTRVSAILLQSLRAAGLRAVGMKPVAAGCELKSGERWNEDVATLSAAGQPAPPALINPYLFDDAIAPHIAAAKNNITIEGEHILECYRALAATYDIVIVEGVGGFCVPLGPTFDTAKMASQLGLPVILVVGMRLGCINHALLTAHAIAAHGLQLHGWVANQIDPNMRCLNENIEALATRLRAPLLGVVPHQPQMDSATTPGLISLGEIASPSPP